MAWLGLLMGGLALAGCQSTSGSSTNTVAGNRPPTTGMQTATTRTTQPTSSSWDQQPKGYAVGNVNPNLQPGTPVGQPSGQQITPTTYNSPYTPSSGVNTSTTSPNLSMPGTNNYNTTGGVTRQTSNLDLGNSQGPALPLPSSSTTTRSVIPNTQASPEPNWNPDPSTPRPVVPAVVPSNRTTTGVPALRLGQGDE